MLTRTRAWSLALVATLTMTVSYLDRQTLSVLAPTVTATFGLSESQYGALLSTFSIAYLLGTPVAGWLLDRVGVRRGLPVSLLLWTLVAAAHAFVPSYGALIALRALLGLAEAPSFPGAAQAIQRVLPPGERARGLGVLFTGSSLGAMVAPRLATSLQAGYGWRGAFAGSALVGLLWLPLWLWLSSSRDARDALDRPDDAAAGRAAPPPVGSLLASPAVLRTMAVIAAAAPAISFSLLWGAKYLVKVHGVTQQDVSRYLWLPPLLYDLGSLLFGDLASRRVARGETSPARGLLLASALLLTTLALAPLGGSPWGSLLWMGLALAGGGGLYAIATADMVARVAPSAVATASGLTAATQSLTYIVLNPVIGRFLDAGGSYDAVLVALGLWALPGSLAWLLSSPDAPRRPPTPASP